MKKSMKIVKDSKQIRTTIPKEFVEEFNVTKEDSVEWDNKDKKLKGEFKKKENDIPSQPKGRSIQDENKKSTNTSL